MPLQCPKILRPSGHSIPMPVSLTFLFGGLCAAPQIVEGGPDPWIKIFDAQSRREMTERDYFLMLLELYNNRNPDAIAGEEGLDEDDE